MRRRLGGGVSFYIVEVASLNKRRQYMYLTGRRPGVVKLFSARPTRIIKEAGARMSSAEFLLP